jgi:glycerol-3-phosphate acyltransferase PlsY
MFGVVWGAVAFISRYSSLSALVASALTPVALWFYGLTNVALLFLILTVLLWVMHRANIARLMNGTEGKIGQKS